MAQRSKVLGPLKKKIADLENRIDADENELAGLNREMVAAAEKGDGSRISNLSRDIHLVQGRIDTLFQQLETVSDDHDRQRTVFDKQLTDLEVAEE